MSMSLLSTWWTMVKADAEIHNNGPLKGAEIVLNFMGSGASCFLTAKDLDNAIDEWQTLRDKKNA